MPSPLLSSPGDRSQPLLPIQGSTPQGRRPGSASSSPARDLLLAARHGDAAGCLRAAAAACLHSPLLLVATVLLMLGVVSLVAWLLPQQALPDVMQRMVVRRSQTPSPHQRQFFEQLTLREQQLLAQQVQVQSQARPPSSVRSRQHPPQQQHDATALDALALPQPGSQQEQQAEEEEQQQGEGVGGNDAAAVHRTEFGNGSEPVVDIHEIAGVSPLFGS